MRHILPPVSAGFFGSSRQKIRPLECRPIRFQSVPWRVLLYGGIVFASQYQIGIVHFSYYSIDILTN